MVLGCWKIYSILFISMSNCKEEIIETVIKILNIVLEYHGLEYHGLEYHGLEYPLA